MYPDAVTLHPGASAEDVLARVDTGTRCSIEDSFAALDLRSFGFDVLFEAQWIHLDPDSPAVGDTRQWHLLGTGEGPLRAWMRTTR